MDALLGRGLESRDGVEIGRVAAVRGDHYQVRVSSDETYWLSFATLEDAADALGQVDGAPPIRLKVSIDELERLKVSPPEVQSEAARATGKLGSNPDTSEGGSPAAEAAPFGGRAAAEASGAWEAREGAQPEPDHPRQ
jgi:hypothetical protein